MEFLSDDPTYPAAALGLAALFCLVLLKATQQGKYLIWAGAAGGLMLLLLLVERVWVTDAERIEDVVYGLAKAVERSNAEAAASFLAPDCVLEPSPDGKDRFAQIVSAGFAGPITRERLEAELSRCKFDFVKVSRLTTRAGAMTRTGTAEFLTNVMGVRQDSSHPGIAPVGIAWTLGLIETTPGVWKVTRITPGRMGGG